RSAKLRFHFVISPRPSGVCSSDSHRTPHADQSSHRFVLIEVPCSPCPFSFRHVPPKTALAGHIGGTRNGGCRGGRMRSAEQQTDAATDAVFTRTPLRPLPPIPRTPPPPPAPLPHL